MYAHSSARTIGALCLTVELGFLFETFLNLIHMLVHGPCMLRNHGYFRVEGIEESLCNHTSAKFSTQISIANLNLVYY